MMELRAENLGRRYFREGGKSNFFFAVKNVTVTVPAGAVTEILGRSGSGKSTLLNMLSGLLEPTTGRVLLDGTDLYALPDQERSWLRNQHIGVIPQGQTGLQSLTVAENVFLPCLMYGEKDSETRALSLLEQVGIVHLKDTYPKSLSGGELRRLAIARALIRNPGVLLADEPTSDLDEENTIAVLKLLRDTADNGTAVLLVTHEKEASAYADRLFVMRDGLLQPAD